MEDTFRSVYDTISKSSGGSGLRLGLSTARKRSSRVYGFFCMRFWLCFRILSAAAAFSSSREWNVSLRSSAKTRM